jgi:hypothetical protein
MAGIDKTYTDNYEEYKKFKIWADKQVITFFDGHTECVGDWVLSYEKEDFDNGEIPIMNTPTWLDIYLIQNCKSGFVIERMKDVYSKKQFEEYKAKTNLDEVPKGYAKNRRIVITNGDKCKFPFKKKMFRKPIGGKMSWLLQCEDNFWYNSETKTWVGWDDFYPHNTNTAHIKSTKALVRHLRKQYLPKGVKFRISGRYVGEEYSVLVR